MLDVEAFAAVAFEAIGLPAVAFGAGLVAFGAGLDAFGAELDAFGAGLLAFGAAPFELATFGAVALADVIFEAVPFDVICGGRVVEAVLIVDRGFGF